MRAPVCTQGCVNNPGGRSGHGGGPGFPAPELEEEGPAFQRKLAETPHQHSGWFWLVLGLSSGSCGRSLPGGGTSVTGLLTSLERVAPSAIKNPRY